MKYYITKYALTQGIVEVDNDSESVRNLKVEDGRLRYFDGAFYVSYSSKEWYTDRPDAIRDAEARKAKKIASLKKQIEALEKKTFE